MKDEQMLWLMSAEDVECPATGPTPPNTDGEGHSCWSVMDLEETVDEEVAVASALKLTVSEKPCAKTAVENVKSGGAFGGRKTAEVVVEDNVRTARMEN